MLLSENWPFLQMFILGNIGRENVFYGILERKNGFLRYKNKNFKKSKKLTFLGKSMLLAKNWQFFQIFILGNIG